MEIPNWALKVLKAATILHSPNWTSFQPGLGRIATGLCLSVGFTGIWWTNWWLKSHNCGSKHIEVAWSYKLQNPTNLKKSELWIFKWNVMYKSYTHSNTQRNVFTGCPDVPPVGKLPPFSSPRRQCLWYSPCLDGAACSPRRKMLEGKSPRSHWLEPWLELFQK